MTNNTLYATFGTFIFLSILGFELGVSYGRDQIKSNAHDKAVVCDKIVWMGLKDWQTAVGVPITKQVVCDALHQVAEEPIG